jgi:hypothetical protein
VSAVFKVINFSFFANEGISATSFFRQVAALVPHMLSHFYFVKRHKIDNKKATTEAGEKIKHIFNILRILEIIMYV